MTLYPDSALYHIEILTATRSHLRLAVADTATRLAPRFILGVLAAPARRGSFVNDVNALDVLPDMPVHVTYEGLQKLPLTSQFSGVHLGYYDASLGQVPGNPAGISDVHPLTFFFALERGPSTAQSPLSVLEQRLEGGFVIR